MRASRRDVLLGVAATALTGPAAAHTPYAQWVVYRQKHLMVGAHRGDGLTYALAQDVVATLDLVLPEARARVARGPRPQRIATLMGTGQLRLAVLGTGEARAMAEGRPPFEGHTPVPLRAVATLLDDYLLWATPDLPDDHAALVADALEHSGLGRAPDTTGVPMHPGVAPVWAMDVRAD